MSKCHIFGNHISWLKCSTLIAYIVCFHGKSILYCILIYGADVECNGSVGRVVKRLLVQDSPESLRMGISVFGELYCWI